jgi:SNF2 family DNA or RNA helicase
VLRPIKNGDTRGYGRLRGILSQVMLRRTKQDNDRSGHRLVELPERVVTVEKLPFSPAERAVYERLWNGTRSKLSDMIGAGNSIFDGYAHVLVMLLRLRQCCDHPALLKQADEDEETRTVACLKCMQEAATMQTACKHLFCSSCLEDSLKQSNSSCPLCARPISALQCRAASPAAMAAEKTLPQLPHMDVSSIASSKIAALMRHLTQIKREDPSVKSVVFSQWTSMLGLIESALVKHGMRFVRLDGSLSQAARNAAIEQFNTDDNVPVFLISTKAGGQGLNLTRASRAFLMDPWWCSATESQAIDRIHRIGQTREVRVVRFIMQDSIEESMLTLQASKNELADRVVASAPAAPSAADIMKLFGLEK